MALARAGGGTPIPALQGLGELSVEEGDLGAARRLFEEALERARDFGHKQAAAQALYGLGQLARGEGQRERAAVLHQEALLLGREIGSPAAIISSLEAIAGLAAEARRHEHAAHLFGAAKALREEKGYASSWGPSRYEADLARVRKELSPEELEAAFAKGAELPLEQAVAEACKDPVSLARREARWSRLSEREEQVAVLVAEGLSNPEIAERLFISRETVKRHLGHIFQKLGVSGRTELAREVGRRGQEPLGNDS